MGVGLSILGLGCSPTNARPPASKAAARDSRSGAAASQATKATPTKPAIDLQGALEREVNGLTTHVVDAGKWQADVLAVSAPVVQREKDFWALQIDIGTAGKVQCFVYERLIDPGQTLAAFLKLASSDKIQSQQVAATNLKIVHETPVVFAEGLYTTAMPNGRAAGLLKVAVQAHETHPVACLHDEMGYRQTFASVVESLAGSVRGLAEPAPAKFVEITRVNLGPAVGGFSFGRLRSSADGGSVWFQQSVQIFMRSRTELLISDIAILEQMDAAGALLGKTSSEAEAGELASMVTLTRTSAGNYAYEGKVQGKPISGAFELKSKDGISSMISGARLLAAAMKKKAPFELTMDTYIPSLDPTKPLQERYKGDGSTEVVASIQDRTVLEKLSPDGHTESWSLTVNGVKITSQRIFTKGSP